MKNPGMAEAEHSVEVMALPAAVSARTLSVVRSLSLATLGLAVLLWFVLRDPLVFVLLALGVPLLMVWMLLGTVARQQASRAGSLTLGHDGLLLVRGDSRTFYSFARVHSVLSTPMTADGTSARSQALLVLKGGGDVRLFWSAPGKLAEFLDRVARIEAARQRYAQAAPLALDDKLARGGRSITAWKADLAGAKPTFRDSGEPVESLAAVLTSAHAPVDERIGAALALRVVAEDPAARHCIRSAASATADPALRDALEAVAEDDVDDRRLEAALARTVSR